MTFVNSNENFPRNFVLAGISGSGKSTVGRHLAVILGFGFLDLDHLIEQIAAKSIVQIFNESGEDGFRALERKALEMATRVKSHVVALGGGALQGSENIELAKHIGPIVWLKPSVDEIARRLVMQVQELERRPLLRDLVKIEKRDERLAALKERISAMTDSRSEGFKSADIVLDGGFVTPETSACQLKEILISMNYINTTRKDFSGGFVEG